MKPVLLIDASIYIFQYYFSLPDHWYSEEEGYPTEAVYGYFTFLLRLLEAENPERIAACFDESLGTCFRNEIYPDYKISRAHPDEALAFQLHACREVSELLGIASFSSDKYEADDLIGTLYKKCQRQSQPIAILTRDKDLGQLLRREQDFLWDYAKDERYSRHHIQKKFGVWPEQMADYLALVGDSIDDIPGVPGIGKKTAEQLLGEFGSVANLLKQLERISDLPMRGAKRIQTQLQEHQAQILMAHQLATIASNVTGLSVKGLPWKVKRVDMKSLTDFCLRMGFRRLVPRVEKVMQLLGEAS